MSTFDLSAKEDAGRGHLDAARAVTLKAGHSMMCARHCVMHHCCDYACSRLQQDCESHALWGFTGLVQDAMTNDYALITDGSVCGLRAISAAFAILPKMVTRGHDAGDLRA